MQAILKTFIRDFVDETNTHRKKINNILKSSKIYTYDNLDEIEKILNYLSYKASILSLTEISELLLPVSAYIRQLKLSESRITEKSLSLLKEVLGRLEDYCKAVKIPDDDGVYINSSSVIINSFIPDAPETGDIFYALEKRQIKPAKINRFKKLSFKKDSDFDYRINLPAGIVKKNAGKYYITLVYADAGNQKSLSDFIISLENLDNHDNTIIHGPLEVPLKSVLEKETALPYYILLKTHEKPDKFLKNNNISGKIVRILHKPEDYAEPDYYARFKQETILSLKNESPANQTQGNAALETKEQEKSKKITPEQYKSAMKAGQIRFSIGFKMITIISMIIILALSSMIFLATWFFLEDSRLRVEENNLKVSEVVSMKVEEDILAFGNAASLLMLGAGQSGGSQEDFVRYFFRNDPEVFYVGIPDIEVNFYNRDILLDYNINEDFINNIIINNIETINQAAMGITAVLNVSPFLGVPVMALSIPYRQGRDLYPMVMLIDIRKSFMSLIDTKGIALTYIVNEDGIVIAHPEESFVINAIDMKNVRVIEDMLASPVSTGQIRFSEEEKTYLGSYKKTNAGRLGIITQVEENLAFEAVYNIQRRNIYLMIMILSISVLIVYFFSKTLTNPVKNLVVATKLIESGEFSIDLKAKTKDEIGVLTTAFVEMGKGLEEKERMKDAFGRFVNQEIAELAMKGEIKLGGEIMPATIFFSDIRSFTAISETLTPSEVVEFLNEYMTLMVQCVKDTHGVVDKYIGDAIMAVWGTPISHGNDAENAVNGALKMRAALLRFNIDRGSEKKPYIKIGSGINSGDVLAGQIGSVDRMEYTVIGDPVNLASRVEGLNKPMGTDILISQNTADLVKEIFDLVPMNKIMVKGKSQPQQIYAVLGRLDDDSRPRTLKELRQRLGITGNFDKISDLEEKEVKYEIIA